MDLGNGLGHLTYSTLVHPADNWEQLWDSLQTYLPQVKARVSPERAVRRLHPAVAPTAAELLVASRPSATKLKQFLTDQDLYVYTANAFLYGVFKGTRGQGAGLRAGLADRGAHAVHDAGRRHPRRDLARRAPPSIQTAPLGFKPHVTGPGRRRQLHRARAAGRRAPGADRSAHRPARDARPRARAALLSRNDRRDRRLLPGTISTPASRPARLAKLAGIPMDTAHGALRRHLGIVFDIGHQAVGFEDIPTSLQKLVDAGIPIFKLQEVAAMHIREVTDEKIEALAALRQDRLSVADGREERRRPSRALPEPRRRVRRLADATRRRAKWRTHFHVPVFLEDLGPAARRASPSSRRSRCTRRRRSRRQLEIETYTWDVLPDHLKTGDIVDYVCRELEWVKGKLL